MLRDPLNRPIPTEGLHVPPEPLRDGKEWQLYSLMLQELDDAERLLVPMPCAPPPFTLLEADIATHQVVVLACRALVLAQSGWRHDALQAAEKSVSKARIATGQAAYWILPLALSYCGLVARSLGHLALMDAAIQLLQGQASRFPLSRRMIDILHAQMNIPQY